MSADQVQATAAVFTCLAAFVAVWATLRGPALAAEFAERLRADGLRAEEQRRVKLNVFAQLLQYRAQIVHPDAVAALNVIDIAFVDAPAVRLAWKLFLASTEESPVSGAKLVEQYLSIIEKMAAHLGFSEDITVNDVRAYYYPTGAAERDEAAWLEMKEKLARYRQPPPSQS